MHFASVAWGIPKMRFDYIEGLPLMPKAIDSTMMNNYSNAISTEKSMKLNENNLATQTI